MKNRALSFLVGLVCVSAVSALASAQDRFSTHSSFTVNPDLNSGSANGSANGDNAVVMNISSNTFFEIDPNNGQAYVSAYMNLRGVWGDPASTSPYYNFLENPGLETSSSLAITTIFWNGQWYQFEDTVRLSLNGRAGLYRNPTHTELFGFSYGNSEGIGAIPISSTSSYHIFEPGHPSFVPDWEVSFGSRWLVTTGFYAVPAPSSLSLLGLGGLVALRRKR